MKAEAALRGAQLLLRQRIASLATLHDGAPSASLTPFALELDPFSALVLVSGLAAHTRDMLVAPRVGLLVAEPERDAAPVHALARIAIQAEARAITDQEPRYRMARAAYEARFPEMGELFSLPDFRLFALAPVAVRVVAGFAQAASVTPHALAEAVRASVAGA